MAVSNRFAQLQQIKFDLFKEQNPEIGRYDVIFEVEGKMLYAHKNMLNLVSPTFASMLSNRWAKKDVPIKIESCSYDNFYQLLTFLYSAQCQLNDENIYSMVDLAEFYGVGLFKIYCGEYLAAIAITTDNVVKLMELADRYSMVQLKAATHEYISKNFQAFVNCDGFLKAGKCFVEDVIASVKDKVKSEDLFQAVYKWAETQAMNKQTDNPNMNLNDAIKNEFTAFLPRFDFDKMEMYFLLDFVVPRGFLFSPNEMSKILCDRYLKTKVKITNSNGQILFGDVIPGTTVVETIRNVNLSAGINYDGKGCWWETSWQFPLTPSPLKEKDEIEWYLICFLCGEIGLRHRSGILDYHYLLAEMTAGTSGFELTSNCKIEIG